MGTETSHDCKSVEIGSTQHLDEQIQKLVYYICDDIQVSVNLGALADMSH